MTQLLHDVCRRSDAMHAFCRKCLERHIQGDWGELDEEDRRLNDEAMAEGEGRIISSYRLPERVCTRIELPDDRVWVITYPGVETTVLFPCDY